VTTKQPPSIGSRPRLANPPMFIAPHAPCVLQQFSAGENKLQQDNRTSVGCCASPAPTGGNNRQIDTANRTIDQQCSEFEGVHLPIYTNGGKAPQQSKQEVTGRPGRGLTTVTSCGGCAVGQALLSAWEWTCVEQGNAWLGLAHATYIPGM
jgi:hypothetical protein